jgi:hypothetical protein
MDAVPDLADIGLNLSAIVDKVILGPSLSSPRAQHNYQDGREPWSIRSEGPHYFFNDPVPCRLKQTLAD